VGWGLVGESGHQSIRARKILFNRNQNDAGIVGLKKMGVKLVSKEYRSSITGKFELFFVGKTVSGAPRQDKSSLIMREGGCLGKRWRGGRWKS